jgi:serralysin
MTGPEADIIQGGDDHDVILAGAGNNSIKGGRGQDNMAGGVNVDVFYFGEVADSGVTAPTRDVIVGFKHGVDKINLVGIDAVEGGANNAFVFNAARASAASLVAAGHVAWYWEDNAGTANDRTIIKLNNDVDAAIDMTIQLNGLINLTAADFML